MAKKTKDPNVSRRDFLTTGVAAGVGTTALAGLGAGMAQGQEPEWHRTADVVIIGAGGSGLPASIRARDLGASVIVVEENYDIGGHCMISGGEITLGGGTRMQKKYKIDDSADNVYLENTRPDHPMTRYNDRNVVRAFADHNVEVYEFLEANGVKFQEVVPGLFRSEGFLTRRRNGTVRWEGDVNETINAAGGSGVARPLEKSARAKGVEFLLRHRMASIVRENPLSGRVIGITTTNLANNSTVNIRARKAVIGCTGGSSSNLVVRTIFDTRLTEEYQVGCEPYTRQSGDTEQQGMAVGASLGSTSNQRNESFLNLQKTAFIGCRYGYARWDPRSPIFHVAGGAGLSVSDYQDAILVNMLGRRFYNEMAGPNLQTTDGMFETYDYFGAALSSAIVEVDGKKIRAGGPVWAIFDADAVTREKWDPNPPFVDVANGYFYSAPTLGELARKVKGNKYQKYPMPPENLEDEVRKYNSYVDQGNDPEFNKPAPKYKIQTPPFYAAWATPILHDTYSGLRVNEKFQVVDIFGKVIPGFYAAGEAAGGMTLHGLGRATTGGYIAGSNAAKEPTEG